MQQSTATQASRSDAVRVFVAATQAEWLPMRVLEFSIRETTELPVELSAIYTHQRTIPTPRDSHNRARTPFSFQRFLIPELCGFQGRAIYLDADMQVFQDIAGLWQRPFHDCVVQTVGSAGARRSQFSVMLLDCSRLPWKIEEIISQLDSGQISYQELMYEMKLAGEISYDIPGTWNSLEHYTPAATCLLHYTDMNTQPWVSLDNPNGELWVACLRRALDSGFIQHDELEREIRLGHVRPSLLPEVSAGSVAPWRPAFSDLLHDVFYTPPFYAIAASRMGTMRTSLSKLSRAGRLMLRPLMRQST